jgi:hypothetical protein
VHRIGRETDHGDVAITLFGCCQPDRFASFGDLGEDGTLQRIIPLVFAERKLSEPSVVVTGQDDIDRAIDLLMTEPGQRIYRTTPEGSQLIRDTEEWAFPFGELTTYGKAFAGFCNKLHGLHARLAFLLHLFDGRQAEPTIPAETVSRAGRLAKFCMLHARAFHGRVPGSVLDNTKDVAGHLLARAPTPGEDERIVASQITSGVRSCRGMALKRLIEVLDPLVTGGWLAPETPWPSCNAWLVMPGLREAFREQRQDQQQRRATIRDRIAEAAAEMRPTADA